MGMGQLLITIAGTPGAGKTTVAEALAKEYNLEYYSIGSAMRQIAEEKGVDVNASNKLGETDPEIDKRIDQYQVEMGKTLPRAVIDGRISFYFIPHSIKILMTCDTKEAGRRIYSQKRAKEKYHSAEEAYKAAMERYNSEVKRYKKYYGVDVTDKNHYDIVYDTTNSPEGEGIQDIIQEVNNFLKKKE